MTWERSIFEDLASEELLEKSFPIYFFVVHLS